VSQDGIAQSRIGKSCDRRDLDGSHDFSGPHAENGESKEAITSGVDEGFDFAAA
jgi:hypothetical protein